MTRSATSVRMDPDEVWDFLAEGHTGILTTLRADGVPIAMPIWYAVVAEAIYLRTRGKKLSRLSRDPRASFLVEEGQRWAELRAVHLTGTAEILEPTAELDAAVDAELERKYARFRVDQAAMPSAARAAYAARRLVRFTPDKRILNWDNRKLGLT